MKTRHYFIFFTIVLTFTFGNYVYADEVDLIGQLEMSISGLDFRNEIYMTDTTQAITGLELKLAWIVNDSLQLHLQIKNEWTSDLKSGNKNFQVKAKRYYFDFSSGSGTSLRIGKQRLRSGCGVFWNPTDFFNPSVGLLKKEDAEDSVEAIHFETFWTGNTLTVMALPVFDENYTLGMAVERVSTGYHIGINSFLRKTQKALGVNLETEVAGINLYSEAAFVAKGEEYVTKGLLGLNYLLSMEYNSSIRTEYHYDKTGSVISNNLAVGLNCSPIDKLNTSCNLFYRFNEKGLMIVPVAKYAFNDYSELTADGLFTVGDSHSLYGNYFIKSKFTLNLIRYF